MGSRSHVFGVLDEMRSDTILIDTHSNDDSWTVTVSDKEYVSGAIAETWEYSHSVRFELGQFCLKKKPRIGWQELKVSHEEATVLLFSC